MLRPLVAGWGELSWVRFAQWSWYSVSLGGLSAFLGSGLALTIVFPDPYRA